MSIKREKTLDELLNESEIKDWLFRAERDMFPKMRESVVSIVIGTENADAKLALEIGAAVMYNKPIIVALPPGRQIPDGLRRIAAVVIEVDFGSGKGVDELQEAIARIIGPHGGAA